MDTSSDEMKWAELLWEEYKYRHELYWKSLYLWGGASVAIYIAPFLQPEVSKLGKAIFIFPVIGLVISLVGAWHLASESERLASVGKKYNQLRSDKYNPDRFYSGVRRNFYKQAVTEPIGKTVTFLFIVGFSVFTVIDILFLYILLFPEKWPIPFSLGIFIFFLTAIVVALIIDRRKRIYNKSLPK